MSAPVRPASEVIQLNHLEEAFSQIPYTTLQQLSRDCEKNVENMVNILTGQGSSEALEGGGTAGGSMTMDDCQNLQRLRALFPQHSDILDDTFYSFSFNFMQTVDFLLNLSDGPPVLSFAGRGDDLPILSTACNPLSSFLSSATGPGGGRRPFRCPHCGHTCPSGGVFRFCRQCGHPLEGRPRL